MPSQFWSAIAACFLIALSGCGADGPQIVSADVASQRMLEDYANFLKQLKSDGTKVPENKNEFMPLEPMAPVSGPGIATGALVVVWGQTIGSGRDIIAFEKSAESVGGYVLQQDGTVRKMTAEEFKAAPKAGKK